MLKLIITSVFVFYFGVRMEIPDRPGVAVMSLQGPYETMDECKADHDELVMYLEAMVGRKEFKAMKCTEMELDVEKLGGEFI